VADGGRVRIFFVNRFFYPDHSATSQMLTDLAFALADRGHRITVVTSRLTYDDTVARLPRRVTVRGVEIVRLATTGFGRTGLLGRAVDYVTFYLAAAWLLLRQVGRGDIVVAKTDPPLLSIVTTPIAGLRGAHAVNWLQDVYPEVMTALGLAGGGRISRIPFAILRWLRDRALRKASLNVAIGERMSAELRRRGAPPDRIRVIPNWADGGLVQPVAPGDNELRRDWGLADTFVVGYSGNLGRAHDAETILAAIALTEASRATLAAASTALAPTRASSDAGIEWLFIGGGAQLATLKARIEQRGDRNVQFVPYQPRDRLSVSLSVPDVHLITLRPALEGLIVPSKYYGIAAAGRPAIFIGDPDGEIGRILSATGTGLIVAEGDGAALARAIVSLAGDRRLVDDMGRRARALFEERYDLRYAVDAWDTAIARLKA
jgi:glycosyltransferase involved in cell wall biosynthesis